MAGSFIAEVIVDHQELTNLPEGSGRYLAEIRNAALGVASTDDMGNAAVATASMVVACGNCHAASGASPRMPDVTPVPTAEGGPSHMRRHQQAVDLMYEGLIPKSQ